MKKMLFSILMMCGLVLTITGCGSKLDKTGEEFKNEIIKEKSERDDKKYKESDFSFLIYKDKDTNRYLAEVWVPYEGEPNEINNKYLYSEDKELETEPFNGHSSFDTVKASGNYEVVYKSGKFK
ncbi:hypothetical protein P0E66_04790 [Enterococcus faecalis]|uniref:hypothetical protein n=1 Tax=Enterococcus faecalis TaxID=1351 RepID=UPI0025AFA54B|nr:hypothetical protein [Enterococcus faecalis]MDN3200454.1 hypothetical protein [Enterococcus faecalis]